MIERFPPQKKMSEKTEIIAGDGGGGEFFASERRHGHYHQHSPKMSPAYQTRTHSEKIVCSDTLTLIMFLLLLLLLMLLLSELESKMHLGRSWGHLGTSWSILEHLGASRVRVVPKKRTTVITFFFRNIRHL